mmetsp:Transcript_16281/g.18055  ORF Transcript_16281/g.18055 Transcript_16281/m.18055 type:complete len:101 (+) Transcript_16281:90-392(+)
MIDPVHIPMIRIGEKPKTSMDVLLDPIKLENNYSPLVHIIFLIQRASLALLILDQRMTGSLQILIISGTSFIKFLYMVIIRPFENPILNFQDSIYEGILM